jgi:hypothetical protein
MNPTRAVSWIGAILIVVLFCIGFGWVPGDVGDNQLRLALLGLAAAGLLWSTVVLRLVARRRDRENAEAYGVAATGVPPADI